LAAVLRFRKALLLDQLKTSSLVFKHYIIVDILY